MKRTQGRKGILERRDRQNSMHLPWFYAWWGGCDDMAMSEWLSATRSANGKRNGFVWEWNLKRGNLCGIGIYLSDGWNADHVLFLNCANIDSESSLLPFDVLIRWVWCGRDRLGRWEWVTELLSGCWSVHSQDRIKTEGRVTMRRKLVCYFSDWSSAVVAISIFKFVSCRRRRTGIVTATVTESLLADTTAVGERKVKEIKQNTTYKIQNTK